MDQGCERGRRRDVPNGIRTRVYGPPPASIVGERSWPLLTKRPEPPGSKFARDFASPRRVNSMRFCSAISRVLVSRRSRRRALPPHHCRVPAPDVGAGFASFFMTAAALSVSSGWSLSAERGLSWRSLPCTSINHPRSKWMRFWRRTPDPTCREARRPVAWIDVAKGPEPVQPQVGAQAIIAPFSRLRFSYAVCFLK